MPPFHGRRRDDPPRDAANRPPMHDVPTKFEAGTPNVAEAIGLGVAIDYLDRLGLARSRARARS